MNPHRAAVLVFLLKPGRDKTGIISNWFLGHDEFPPRPQSPNVNPAMHHGDSDATVGLASRTSGRRFCSCWVMLLPPWRLTAVVRVKAGPTWHCSDVWTQWLSAAASELLINAGVNKSSALLRNLTHSFIINLPIEWLLQPELCLPPVRKQRYDHRGCEATISSHCFKCVIKSLL